MPRLQTFDSLIAYPDYRLLWIGNFSSNSAQWMQLLTVGWLVRGLTSGSSTSALLVVTVGGMSTLPGLVVGPWGGVLGDRVDRRKLIMGIQCFMTVFALLFAFMVGARLVTVWHAYLYVFISGICLSVTQPIRQTLIANTVPPESLANAYATNIITIPGTRMIGPFIGGIMITTLGFFWNFTLESMLYAGTVLAYIPMKTPYASRRRGADNQSMVGDLVDGVKYVWQDNRILLYLMLLSLIPNTLLQPIMFLLPVFTEDVLHRGADIGGLFLAINGFGGVLVAFVVASVGFIFTKGKICLATTIISSVLALLFSHAYWLPVAFILMGLFAASQTAYRTTNGTLLQMLVPDTFRGRVTSLQRYSQGFVVLFSLVVGWFAGLTSVSITIAVLGVIGIILGSISVMMARQISRLD